MYPQRMICLELISQKRVNALITKLLNDMKTFIPLGRAQDYDISVPFKLTNIEENKD